MSSDTKLMKDEECESVDSTKYRGMIDDADGVECLSNEDIFAELARMGYEKPPHKLTFYKEFFSTQWKFLIHTLVQCLSTKKTVWNEFSCSMASAFICLAIGRKFNFSKYIFDNMVRNVDSPSKFLMYPHFLQVVMDNQVDDMTSHNTRYTFPALTQKVFANMRRVGKEVEVPIALAPSPLTLQDPTPTPYATPLQDQPSTPHASPPQEQPTTTFESSMSLLTTLMETCATLSQKVVSMDAKPQGRINQEDVNATSKGVSTDEPTIAQKLHDEEVQKFAARDRQEKADMERALKLQRQYDDKEENIDWSAVAKQTLFKPDKDVKKPKKKRVADETLLQESFKKLKADEVLGSESTQELPSNNPKEMFEEDVQNMLEIFPVFEFKVKALQVKYPIIDWEIHTEGSRTYWKIIRVSEITEAYQSFEDMLKGFDKEYLVALWNLVKEKFSSTVPSVDKEKALWVELKRLFEPDADDVLWKLQRYMHAPLTWKLYIDCGVHHVSSTRRDDIFMLTEKDYPLSNVVMIPMLSGKLQVEEDNEMARDLVMKIFIEANKPKSKSLDTSSK
nr:hypothetical protein [Tanacetum cinerariifolium]